MTYPNSKLYGPKGIRTPDLAVKSRLLYRAELWAHVVGLGRFWTGQIRPRSRRARRAQGWACGETTVSNPFTPYRSRTARGG